MLKGARATNTSLVGRLLEDYETEKIIDPDHLDDIKLVGTVMYMGENHFNPLKI